MKRFKRKTLLGLNLALKGLPPGEIDDLVADYGAHFTDAGAAGRSEEEVAAALGDPERLARELRAEAGLRRWETQRTPTALVAAIASLGGMLALDVFILLPFLLVVGVIVFALGAIVLALGVAGLGLVLSGVFHWSGAHGIINALARTLGGVGLIGGSVGLGCLMWIVLEALLRFLGRYVRLHYRVLKPLEQPA